MKLDEIERKLLQAYQHAEQGKDGDIVLMLGRTGAGKSTTGPD